MAKPRDPKPGELRGIKILELIERLSKRPESRVDLERALERLSPDGQIYIRHLVMSGPSSDITAAKASGLKKDALLAAAIEVETKLDALRRL